MDLAAALIKEPWFRQLGKRAGSFYQMIKHLDQFSDGCIIETGTAWDRNNWEGQGQSTLIWDWVLQRKAGLSCVSIDIMEEHVRTSDSQTKRVDYMCGDSVKTLNGMAETLRECRLLYLDSFDWSPSLNLESAFHHMAELTACWRHLPSGCMIVVDDRHGAQAGKHWMVEGFFSKLGIEPVFCDYQVGWLKP